MTELGDPFELKELKFYPVTIKDGKGLVATYIDARCVMDRLDAAIGAGNWKTEHRVIDPVDKVVECTLSLLIDGAWVWRSDVGYPNEARDADNPDKEPWKAAYSDSLKRAAVQFGVGRYIYSIELERNWLPVDANKRFTEQPRVKGSPQQGGRVGNAGERNPVTQPQGQEQDQRPPAAAPPTPLRAPAKPAATNHWTEFWRVMHDMGYSNDTVTAKCQAWFGNREPRQLSESEQKALILRLEQEKAKETANVGS